MKKEEREKLNQKGFSLLEIIVALAIFSISALVISKGFYRASVLNRKSAKIQDATAAAKNLIEEVKSKSVGELMEKYKGEKGDEGIYTFSLSDILCGKHHFDMQLTLDASVYYEDGKTGPNDASVPSIAGLNVSEDAFFVAGDKTQKTLMEHYGELYAASGNGELSQENLWKNLERKLEVKAGSEGGYEKAWAEYHYFYRDPKALGCVGTAHGEDAAGCTCAYQERYLIYDNSESGKKLRAVYLFYRPDYDSVDGDTKDRILIKNNMDRQLDFYVIKQMPHETLMPGELAELLGEESRYRVAFDVEAGKTSEGKSAVRLFTNLDQNLASVDAKGHGKEESQVRLTYRDPSSSPPESLTGTEAKEAVSFCAVGSGEEKDRLYDICVKVYEPGEKDAHSERERPILELHGAKIEG